MYYIMVKDYDSDAEEYRYNCRFDDEFRTMEEVSWYTRRGYDVMVLSIEGASPTLYPSVVACFPYHP